MLAPPFDFDTAQLANALNDGWGIDATALDYLPVGFGSHHWRATGHHGHRWFVTVDEHREAGAIENLRRAFSSALALRRDAGLGFVLAPLIGADGGVIRVLQEGRFTAAVTPWIDATPLGHGEIESDSDRADILGLLDRLHAARPSVEGSLPPEVDLALPDRDELCRALDDLDGVWRTGRYGEATRALLGAGRDRIVTALDRYDTLEEIVQTRGRSSWVVSHGEPHSANVLRDGAGALHLIDWDTLRLAPRERDLAGVLGRTTDFSSYPKGGEDEAISAAALRLFRMRWDLGEIGAYVAQFHAPHEDDPNTREAWNNLNTYLPVSEDHLLAVIH